MKAEGIQASGMEKKYILKVAADGRVEREEFDEADSLGQLQRAVGGYIERVPVALVDGHDLFVNEEDLLENEEGLLERLPLNVVLTKMSRIRSNDRCMEIRGAGVFSGHAPDGETIGLTEAECADFERMLARFGATIGAGKGE